jgi:hypothetical protein
MIYGDFCGADLADRMVVVSDSLVYATIYFKVARILSKLVGSGFTCIFKIGTASQDPASRISHVAFKIVSAF